MKLLRTFSLALAVAAGSSAAQAGPCRPDIAKLQFAFDQRLKAAAAKGPSAPTAPEAKLHRQPTPKSMAEAEAKLGDITPEMGRAFGEAIQRARAADAVKDKAACRAALADAKAALKR